MKICLDPGHGMSNRAPGVFDPGATKNGREEANLAWMLADTIEWVAKQEFPDIVIMRTRANFHAPCPVSKRAKAANDFGADVMISIHWNDADTASANGTETYYRDDKDRKLANLVQHATLQAFGTRDRGLKTEDESQHTRLAVFNCDAPTCLLEVGFIGNEGDFEKVFGDLAASANGADDKTARDRRIEWARVLLKTIDNAF